jgi:hypothetical protein
VRRGTAQPPTIIGFLIALGRACVGPVLEITALAEGSESITSTLQPAGITPHRSWLYILLELLSLPKFLVRFHTPSLPATSAPPDIFVMATKAKEIDLNMISEDDMVIAYVV